MRSEAAPPAAPRSGGAPDPSSVRSGLAWGFLEAVSFSASLPAARLAALHLVATAVVACVFAARRAA